ncbi:MAG: sortase [Patescibacteria group bacterium]
MNSPDTNILIETAWRRKGPFFIVFAGVFVLSYGLLFAIDFIPEAPAEDVIQATDTTAEAQAEAEPVENQDTPVEPVDRIHNEAGAVSLLDEVVSADVAALPNQIIIDRLDRTIPINNPTSRSIADLDEALLTGAVRHPDSATFTNEGTIFVLAHSSYLPNVLNEFFQAFNGIQNLEWGDTIRLQSEDMEYVYRVERVYQAKASEVTVPIANTGPRLTLATCNSFASKDDRYIVESKLIETRSL